MSQQIIEQKIRDYNSNNTDGSVNLLIEAFNIINEWSNQAFESSKSLLDKLYKLIHELISCHPSMYVIKNSFLLFSKDFSDTLSSEDTVEAAKSKLQNLLTDYKNRQHDTINSIAKCFGNMNRDNLNLLTISNSNTVMNAILNNKKKISKAFVLESRPINEGIELTKHLSKKDIETHLLYDMQCGYYLDEIDIIIIGSDAITSEGDVINKMGSKVLAILASYNKIPFYVLTQTTKIMGTEDSKYKSSFEKHNTSEISTEKLNHVTIENIYFDVTPSKLITNYITEDGIYNQSDVKSKSLCYSKIYKSLKI